MNLRSIILLGMFSSAVVFSASCSKDKVDAPASEGNDSTEVKDSTQIEQVSIESSTITENLTSVTVENLAADPLLRDTANGQTIGHLIEDQANHYTLFSLSNHEVVPNSDSATTKWDIGFNQTSIIINSSVSGPGSVEGQILTDTVFAQVLEAPENGYVADSAEAKAFSGWYAYAGPPTHAISPKDKQVYIIHTNDDKYVKLEILNFYEGLLSPEEIDFKTSQTGFYSFKYTIQAEKGSRSLTK